MSAKKRLLQCRACKTIEQIDWYEGPEAGDHDLAYLVGQHSAKHPEAANAGCARLFTVDADDLASPPVREQIIERIKQETGETGLGSAFYTYKDTLKDDALKCFADHRRNPACPDFHSDKKLLSFQGTADLRKDTGLPKYNKNITKRWLCDFCPVASVVMQASRKRKGLYN